MILKEYQKIAIMDLLTKSKKLLSYPTQKKMVIELDWLWQNHCYGPVSHRVCKK